MSSPTLTSLRAEVRLEAQPEGEEARLDRSARRRFLVLGDFSGRESRGGPVADRLAEDRVPLPIDAEDLDAVLARIAPELLLPLPEATAVLRPRCLDDFHPDRLFLREPVFADLRRLRADTDAEGERPDDSPAPPESPAESRGARPDDAALSLDELLEGGRPPGGRTADRDLDDFLEEVVRPHAVPAESPERARRAARVEERIADRMRRVLHARGFQALESAWRGVDLLLRRLAGGDGVSVEILDVTKEELARDLKNAPRIEESGLHRILAGSPGAAARPWRAVAMLYEFAASVEDVALLARLGRIASSAGAFFVGDAAPALLGTDRRDAAPDPRRLAGRPGQASEELWSALRSMPEAQRLGLAWPRFLLRLPYGERTDPTERFPFEEIEIEGAPSHEEYLWGSPSLLCLLAVSERGPVADLPLHVFERDGETRTQPSAETLLPSSAIEGMIDRGIMPVVALPDRDAVVIPRLQSIADPPTPLGLR